MGGGNLIRRAIRPLAAVLLAVALLSGCETPEYRAAEGACAARWHQTLPPLYQRRQVIRNHRVLLPDGTENCKTERVRDRSDPDKVVIRETKTCRPNERWVDIPYVSTETVDLRHAERAEKIRGCAEARCLATHGNVACKRGR